MRSLQSSSLLKVAALTLTGLGLCGLMTACQGNGAHEAATIDAAQAAASGTFRLSVRDAIDQAEHPGLGTLTPLGGGAQQLVLSGEPMALATGQYQLQAGILTRMGTAYQPVTQTVEIARDAETHTLITAPLPARLRAQFTVQGEPVDGAPIDVFNMPAGAGKKLLSFGADEEIFIDDGSYFFRSSPNPANQNLQVAQTVVGAEQYTVRFDLRKTVQVFIKHRASHSDLEYGINPALWREGELAWRVHAVNGGQVTPGEYEVRIDNGLVRHRAPLTVTEEDEKTYEVLVPSAHITVQYQNADGSEGIATRVGIQPNDFESGGRMRQSSTRLPLPPGSYTLVGWPPERGYEDQTLALKAGDDRVIMMQARQ